MSGFLATSAPASPTRWNAALGWLARLGTIRTPRSLDGGAERWAVARHDWERDPLLHGTLDLFVGSDLVVVADAALYHRNALLDALGNGGADSAFGEIPNPTALIARAYRAWGPDLIHHLTGDYAFVVWERATRRFFAARDPIGLRPLHYAKYPGGLALASTARTLAELLGRGHDVDSDTLGLQAAGLAWSLGTATAFRGVTTLPPGHRLSWTEGQLTVERFWHPPERPDHRPPPFQDAAVELRHLLESAVTERMGPGDRGGGTAAVWMSGGWDSTAVFAAGQHALRAEERHRLTPVSISYPANDPGHEDPFIRSAAAHWGANVHWLASEEIPLFAGLEERAGAMDEPPAGLYELWNRALGRGARAVEARVALDGNGGDQLFQASDMVLSDLLRRGEWMRWARMARSRRRYGTRHVLQSSLYPLLPTAMLRGAERLLQRRVPRHYLERPVASWTPPALARSYRDRDLGVLGTIPRTGAGEAEALCFLMMPAMGYAGAFMRGALVDEGIDLRSPLLDQRVVEFALRRPVAERADHRGTKHLLREAMRGLLPPEVLASRPYRTGVTVGYSRRQMRAAYPGLLRQLLDHPLRLADLGLVEPRKVRDAAEQYCRGDAGEYLRVNLYHLMKVEFWLRGFDRSRPGPSQREAVACADQSSVVSLRKGERGCITNRCCSGSVRSGS